MGLSKKDILNTFIFKNEGSHGVCVDRLLGGKIGEKVQVGAVFCAPVDKVSASVSSIALCSNCANNTSKLTEIFRSITNYGKALKPFNFKQLPQFSSHTQLLKQKLKKGLKIPFRVAWGEGSIPSPGTR